MTHTEFNQLYDSGEINLKIYDGYVGQTHKTVEAFQYKGKFYLRIHIVGPWYTAERYDRFGRKHAHSRRAESHYIKEFGSKQRANNYFKKISAGLRRTK